MTTYPKYDPTALFAGEGDYRHEPGTLVQSATVYKRGTFVGRIGTTDTFAVCVKTATDGSQIPSSIVAAETDATAGPASGPLYFDGTFAAEICTIDPSWTIQTLRDALRQAGSQLDLRSVGRLG